jgi:hypothetical protein
LNVDLIRFSVNVAGRDHNCVFAEERAHPMPGPGALAGGAAHRLAVDRQADQLAAFMEFPAHLGGPVPGIGQVQLIDLVTFGDQVGDGGHDGRHGKLGGQRSSWRTR